MAKDLTDAEHEELTRIIDGFLSGEAWVLVSQAENGTQVMSNLNDPDHVVLLLEEGENRVAEGPPPEEGASRRRDS